MIPKSAENTDHIYRAVKYSLVNKYDFVSRLFIKIILFVLKVHFSTIKVVRVFWGF